MSETPTPSGPQPQPVARAGANINDDGDKGYLLHLYDALWENMRSKENRLWTFLSLYGAAVGLVFAGGQVSQIPGADLFAIVIVMGLSTWAVLIIINTNWWYYRNQLMVSRIEQKFPEAVKGVVPKIYNENPNYRFDALSQGSILLLTLLLFFLYARTIWSYHSAGSINSIQSLIVVVLLYVLFVFSTVYCLRLHEFNIEAYYLAKKDILKDASTEPLSSNQRLTLLNDQTQVRRDLDVRPRVVFLLIPVAVLFDFIVYRNGASGFWLTLAGLSQAGALTMFVVQRYFYLQKDSEPDLKLAVDLIGSSCEAQREKLSSALDGLEDRMKLKRLNNKPRKFLHSAWPMMLLVAIPAVMVVPTLYRSNQKLRDDWSGAKAVSASDLGQQINKMGEDLEKIQKSFNELQQSNVQLQKQLLDEKLAPYTKREEAEQRFATKDELKKFRESKAKGNNQQ